MPLRNVRNFVRHDSGQFRFGLRGENQPGMNTDEATRHGEGVDAGVVDREKLEPERGVVADRHQAGTQLI